MIRGTTPTHIFETSISLAEASEIYVTYKQGKRKIEKSIEDLISVTDTEITVELSQLETLEFASGGYKAQVQIRAMLPGDKAVASNIMEVDVCPILKEGVI